MKNIISWGRKYPIPMIILAIEVLLIIYLNLFQSQNYLGYDASVYYLQTIETWEQKKLFLDNWVWQTTLCWDSTVILASLIYGISGNVFFSMGLSNIVFIAGFICILYGITKLIHLSHHATLWFFCILFTPYISTSDQFNNLGYFAMMFFDSCGYLVKNGIIFFIIYVSSRINRDGVSKKNIFLIFLSFVAVFISSMSSGYYVLIFGLLPIAICYFFYIIINNNFQKNDGYNGVYICICTILALIGKISIAIIYQYESHGSDAIWTSITQFWDNFFSIISGFFILSGFVPEVENLTIFSFHGIGYIFRILLIFLLFCGIFILLYSLKKKKINLDYTVLNLLFLVLANIAVFTFCYTNYGAAIFEYRYLIIIFIAIMLLGALGIDCVISNNNNNIFKILLQLALTVSLIATNAYSYYYLNLSRYDSKFIQQIIDIVNAYEADVVYIIEDGAPVWARNIRVLDKGHIYNTLLAYDDIFYWGSYSYYADASEYTGPTLLICSDEKYQQLPEFIKNRYIFQTTAGYDTLGIYLADRNPLDFMTGVSGDTSLDFMYSKGISKTPNGSFDGQGNFVTDGTEGFATWGPYSSVPEGTYQFTLNYEVVGNPDQLEQIGEFDVAVNAQRIAVVPIEAGKQTVTVEVNFDGYMQTDQLEYRTYVKNGIQLKLQSIEIIKV